MYGNFFLNFSSIISEKAWLGNSRSEILSRKTKPVLSPFICTCRKSHTKNAQEQALTSMQELFKDVSSAKEADTPTHPPGNSSSSDEEPGPSLDTRSQHASGITYWNLCSQKQIQLFFGFYFKQDRRK